jgi:WD40 repeat protein
VALSFDAWKAGAVQPATVKVPVRVIETVESPQLTATLKGHEEPVRQVAWASDGKTLATLAGARGKVTLWNIAERKDLAALKSDLGSSESLAFLPNGKTLAVGHFSGREGRTDGGISLWDVATGRQRGLLRHTPPRGVTGLALAPDGKTIAAVEMWKEDEKGKYKRAVTLWDVAGGKVRGSLAGEITSALAFSPDGKVLARSVYVIKENQSVTSEVRRRDLTNGQDLPALPNTASKRPLNSLVFSPDGRALAGADPEGNVLLWDTATAKVRTTLKLVARWRTMSLAFSPDGKTLATAAGDRLGRDHEPGLIVLWDAASGQRRLTLTGHTNAVLTVTFSPDGKFLASGGSDRTVRLWDLTIPSAPSATGDGRR